MTDGMQDPKPEKGVPPKDKPDIGQKPDLKNPEKPEEEVPDQPIPEMDPPGQDDPDEAF
jgi:hypothetical protein